MNTNEVRKLEFGTTFSNSFELFKGVFLYGAVMVLAYTIFYYSIEYVLGLIFNLKEIQTEFEVDLTKNGGDFNRMVDVFVEYISNPVVIITSIIQMLSYVFIYPLSAGYLHLCRNYHKTGKAEFSDMFIGYSGKYFGNLMLLYIIYVIIGTILKMMFLIPGIYFWSATIIAAPFVLFQNNNAIDAIKNSIKVMNSHTNWLTAILLLIVAGICSALGFIGLCIGVFFTAPFYYVVIYMIYDETVGNQDESSSEINEIGME